MKTMRIIAVLLILLFPGCTSTVHVSSDPDTIYPHHRTIAVSCNSDDPLSIRQTLEHLLISKGFNVVLERVARIKANMQNGKHATAESKERTFRERSKEMRSIYILHFSYEYYSEASYKDYYFKIFSASLVDLKDGNVVASSDFSQSSFGTKPILSVLEDFVNKLTDLN
jgi:hypothetical protein